MAISVKLAGSYSEVAGVYVKTDGAYSAANLSVKSIDVYVDLGGGAPPSFAPSLDFSDARNSQYLALVSVGGM